MRLHLKKALLWAAGFCGMLLLFIQFNSPGQEIDIKQIQQYEMGDFRLQGQGKDNPMNAEDKVIWRDEHDIQEQIVDNDDTKVHRALELSEDISNKAHELFNARHKINYNADYDGANAMEQREGMEKNEQLQNFEALNFVKHGVDYREDNPDVDTMDHDLGKYEFENIGVHPLGDTFIHGHKINPDSLEKKHQQNVVHNIQHVKNINNQLQNDIPVLEDTVVRGHQINLNSLEKEDYHMDRDNFKDDQVIHGHKLAKDYQDDANINADVGEIKNVDDVAQDGYNVPDPIYPDLHKDILKKLSYSDTRYNHTWGMHKFTDPDDRILSQLKINPYRNSSPGKQALKTIHIVGGVGSFGMTSMQFH